MNNLVKVVLFAAFLIVIYLLLSQYYQQSRRTYSLRTKTQLKMLKREVDQHLALANSLKDVDPKAGFQQSCYAAATIDAMRQIAPAEDLQVLIHTNLDSECEQAKVLQNYFNNQQLFMNTATTNHKK